MHLFKIEIANKMLSILFLLLHLVDLDLVVGWRISSVSGYTGSSACGILLGGKLVCWGDNTLLSAAVLDDTDMYPEDKDTYVHSLRPNGYIKCWNSDQNATRVFDDEAESRYIDLIDISGRYICAIRSNYTLL
jgi:hypothetical protein